MAEPDLAGVDSWLREPHVARWWTPGTCAEEEVALYRRRVAGEDPRTRMLIAEHDGVPIGWCQWYCWEDYPAEASAMGSHDAEVGFDYAIGDPKMTGRGVGTTLIAALVRHVRLSHFGAGFLSAPHARNAPSRRVLEKNGFTLVAVRAVVTEPTDAPMAIYRLLPGAPA
jgi:aminoglycoside 6'-N-acetyltransferase